MRVGVIGLGIMGNNHLRVYSELKDVTEIHGYDVNQELYSKSNYFSPIKYHKDIEDFFSSIDVVSICTPTPYHHLAIKECLERSIPFLVEKPIFDSLDRVNILEQFESKPLCGVGHIERFNPVITELSRIITPQSEISFIQIKRHNPSSSRITDITVVEDLMIHDIDLLSNSLGLNINLKSACGNDNSAVAMFTTTHPYNSVPILISASRNSAIKEREIYIELKDKTLKGDLLQQELYEYDNPKDYSHIKARFTQSNTVKRVNLKNIEPLRKELSLFLNCYRLGISFPISLEQGVENVKICKEINKYLFSEGNL